MKDDLVFSKYLLLLIHARAKNFIYYIFDHMSKDMSKCTN